MQSVNDFIDSQPLGRYQALVVTLCALVLLVDGFDAQAIGFVAPALGRQLHLTRAALGPVFSSGLVGIMIMVIITDAAKIARFGIARARYSSRVTTR